MQGAIAVRRSDINSFIHNLPQKQKSNPDATRSGSWSKTRSRGKHWRLCGHLAVCYSYCCNVRCCSFCQYFGRILPVLAVFRSHVLADTASTYTLVRSYCEYSQYSTYSQYPPHIYVLGVVWNIPGAPVQDSAKLTVTWFPLCTQCTRCCTQATGIT